jgi:C4-dicarboxylate transporter/malic acid transport protein
MTAPAQGVTSAPTTAAGSALSTWHPGWTGVALGTAGVAAVGLADPVAGSQADTWLGAVVALVATLLLLVLGAVLVARLLRHREHAARDLGNPGIGAQYGTFPAAVLVVALTWTQLALQGRLGGWSATGAAVLLVVGVVLALVVGLGFFHGVVSRDEIPVAAVTGAWFVPIVVLVLVPSIVTRLVLLQPGWASTTVLALTAAAWGAGLMLFLLLAPIVGWRLLTGPAQAAHAAPSWWIWLAPAGAGGVGAIALSRLAAGVVREPAVVSVLPVLGLLLGTAMWGFGLWWAALAARSVLTARAAAGGLPFHVGSWGFVFPSAAMTLLTIELGRSWDSGAMSVLGAVLAAAVLLLWVVVSWLTVRGLRDRSILER